MKNELQYLTETEREAVNSFMKQLEENLGDQIVDIRLFGSKVRGDFHRDSDIDIFILVKERGSEIEDMVSEIEVDHDIEYGLPLSTVLYSLFEYRKNKELGSFFFENVEKEGVSLYNRINLAKYRIEKAQENLQESEDAFKQDHFGMSVNRSYYAMFTSARAILALRELDSSKHSGVIALFSQHILKPGLFPIELGRFLRKAKRIREDADYGDFVGITIEDAQAQLEHAKTFVREAENSLKQMKINYPAASGGEYNPKRLNRCLLMHMP